MHNKFTGLYGSLASDISKRPSIMTYYTTALRRVQRVQISHGICTPEDQLDRFPAFDQSVSWISRANSVPLLTLLLRIPHK